MLRRIRDAAVARLRAAFPDPRVADLERELDVERRARNLAETRLRGIVLSTAQFTSQVRSIATMEEGEAS